jgi:hypothetical protein
MKRLPAPQVLGLFALLALGGCNFGTAPGGTEGEGLTGILVDTRGVAVANVRMRLYPESGGSLARRAAHIDTLHRDSLATDAKGRFDFRHAAKGRYNLSATLRRGDTTFAVYVKNIFYNGGRLDLGHTALKITGGIKLHVGIGTEGNSPPPAGIACGVPGSPFSGTLTEAGDCVVNGLPPGEFQLEITAPGFHPALSDALAVIPGAIADAGSVDLILSSEPAPPAGRQFPALSSTIALWTFNAYASGSGNRFEDQGPGGFTLSGSVRSALEASPKGSALVFKSGGEIFSTDADTAFVPASRKVTLEARLRLSSYPNPSNTEASGLVVGMKDGIRLLVGSDGSLRLSGPQTAAVVAGGASAWIEDATAFTAAGTVPLNQWVTVAVAVDLAPSGSQSYAYLNGEPVQLYRKGEAVNVASRPASSLVTVGNGALANQPFDGRVDEIRLSNALVLGPGLPLVRLPADPVVPDPPTPASATHFSRTASTIALWTFDSKNGNQFADSSGNGRALAAPAAATLSSSPHGNAASFSGSILTSTDTALLLAGQDLITYEARIWMDAYPSASLHNRVSHILGNYGGLELFVRDNGGIQVIAQKGIAPDWLWFGGETAGGTLPLGQWVDVAVAADKQGGVVYIYVNGVPVQFYTPSGNPGTVLRSYAETPFSIGANSVDGQAFAGKIDEVRVSKGLVLGPGLPVLVHPLMVWSATLTVPAVPVLSGPPHEASSLQPVSLEWGAVSGAGVYHVQVATDAGFAAPVINDSLVISTSRSAVGLASGTTYYWRVRARNGAGASAFSAARSFTAGGSGGLGTAAALVASWNFEDSTGAQILDRSGNGHHGTLTGPLVNAAGINGKALQFDGSQSVEVPPSTAFSAIGSFTLSVWVRQSSNTVEIPVLEFAQPGNFAGPAIWLNTVGNSTVVPGTVYPSLRWVESPPGGNANNTFATAPNLVVPNVWTHIVETYESETGIGRLYVDGVQASSLTVDRAFPPTTAGSLFMGLRPTSSLDSERGKRFKGQMDEVRVYKGALSSAQVQALYLSR